MVRIFTRSTLFALGLLLVGGLAANLPSAQAQTPTPELAMTFRPTQKNIEYAQRTAEEIRRCTIRPEKNEAESAWVVRDEKGEVLRRFADTNGDNQVDLWCFYMDGLEVYRDVDSDSNGKVDQYRWFHTGGTRWGIDDNEDGHIDRWQVISAPEVAEELISAIQNRDRDQFELLLLTSDELDELGLSKTRQADIREAISNAPSNFRNLASEQKVVTSSSQYVDFGSTRPATVPSGTEGSTKDLTVHDNVTALVETDGKYEQVYLGALVAVDGGWRLIDLPSLTSEESSAGNSFMLTSRGTGGAGGEQSEAPSEQMQRMIAELERLDTQAASKPPSQQAKVTDDRVDLLLRMAEASGGMERDQWVRQLTSMLNAAVQSGQYPQGIERFDRVQKQLTRLGVNRDLMAHVEFNRMWAEFGLKQQAPEADYMQIRDTWLADLEAFAKKNAASQESTEALLQLGMEHEFSGEFEEGQKWYRQLVTNYPESSQADKAKGAIRRLTSVGNPIALRGSDVRGSAIDLASYRGKLVLIHYWATWCDVCTADMDKLKDIYAKHGGRGFDIIGVCLDDTSEPVQSYLSQHRYPWKHVYEPGGLDGRLANEMGVITLPLMLLVDQRGNVVNHSIHVAELEAELSRLASKQN